MKHPETYLTAWVAAVLIFLSWLTPHIGLINDFSWNVIEGRDNNFGMVRTGINFAF